MFPYMFPYVSQGGLIFFGAHKEHTIYNISIYFPCLVYYILISLHINALKFHKCVDIYKYIDVYT